MEIKINDSQRITILKQLISHKSFLGKYGYEGGGILSFLEMIWDLRSMPSQDSRYTNARDDIWKHIVANDDMTIEELFIDRLPSSYKDDEKFVALINSIIHPSVIDNEAERDEMVSYISNLVTRYGYRLTITDYFGDIPVYTFTDNANVTELPKGIKPNDIWFYKSSFQCKTYPCFTLEFNNGWNDWFTWMTSFRLSYHESDTSQTTIGSLKIMKFEQKYTNDVLPDSFTSLDSTFCSIGTEEEFYLKLKEELPQNFHSVFLALRDAAIFPSIKEVFENDECFKNSLLRGNKQLLDSARYIMNGIDVRSYYKFSYTFLPPYSPKDDNEYLVNLDFNFKYGTYFDQRIYAVIGKNGTGKTTLLSQMANDFSSANSKNIIPQKPLYNKIITISFSFFDKLPLPTANAQFNYTYLGLKGKNQSIDVDVNATLKRELRTHLNRINEKNRCRVWNSIVKKLFHSSINDVVIDAEDCFKPIDIDRVFSAHVNFSSGENLLLYIISSIISEIQDNTLILFDEPESHLHPNAISILMNVLYSLLGEFNSFAIIATHSPIVIQEVSSRNVKVFKRDGDLLEVSNIGHETFSENLTTITDEIFGNREIAKYHTSIIKEIIENKSNNITYEELLNIFKNEQIPTPLNLKLFLKDLLNEKP